ncbi:Glycosyl transferase family protein [Gammaproteobacteria bacterium]
MNNKKSLKFLVIRRDNIGDLVCTTPVFVALRNHFPSAEIHALVTSYNHAVLENNPTVIDQIVWYGKAKHQPTLGGKITAYWRRITLLVKLRHTRFDYAIIPTPCYEPRSLRLARLIGAKRVIGFGNSDQYRTKDYVIPQSVRSGHHVECTFQVLTAFGITAQPGPVQIFPDSAALRYARERIAAQGWSARLLIGIHISARKPSQRWPAECFALLMARLRARYPVGFLLFWSPGDTHHPAHPGDNAKAAEIMNAVAGLPVLAFPSAEVSCLIGGIACCDFMVCSDGGAMHLAAGLGKPIVCFFGKSNAQHWHPWGVPHELLQPPSQEVSDISVEEALHAVEKVILRAVAERRISL